MFVLGLWTLTSIVGCCIGFTIIQRPAEYYDYQRNLQEYQWEPSEYEWQPLEYQWQPTEYQEQPYDYQPYDYQPYDYQRYDYQTYAYQPYDYKPYEYRPSYSSYYYYYYPLYKPSASYGYDTNPSLPYALAQELLQVYRVIRVIEVFRYPVHKPVTSLDLLVHELTDDTLQQQLVKLLYNVHGYEEVAQLKNHPSIKVMNSFVNDYRRLLLAIQRALNGLDLTTDLDDHHLTEKLRDLRHQANALTVEQIGAELHQGLKVHAKEAVVTDVLENLLGQVESKGLEEFHEKHDVVVKGEDKDEPLDLNKVEKYPVVIDEPKVKVQQEPKQLYEIDEKDLDDLAAALELYLEEQKIVESNMAKEKSTGELEQVVESVAAVASATEVGTTTNGPLIPTIPPIPTEATKDTWLGSLFGKGNLLTGHYGSSNEAPESQKLPQPIDVSQPAVLVKPVEQGNENIWVHEDVLDKEPLEFDIDQRLQTEASAAKTNAAVTHSVPLWLIENSKNQKVESKQVEPEDIAEDQVENVDELQRQLPDDGEGGSEVDNRQMELEDVIEDQNEDQDELFRQLPEVEDEQEVDLRQMELEDMIESRTVEDDQLPPVLPEHRQTEALDVAEDTAEGEAREIPVDEEKLQTVQEEEGPARFDLPVDLSDHHQLSSTPKPVPIDEQQELQRVDLTTETSTTPVPTTVDQHTTLNINEVRPESPSPVESREDQTPVAQTGRLDLTTEASTTAVPTTVDQHTTLNIYEVHTEGAPVESREQPTPVTQPASSEPDARRFVREEVLKVLNLLEESNGFVELKERITRQDLNELVDELSSVQVGIRWTEMITALQKLITGKTMADGERIVEVLEHWKEGEEGHLDDGYFDRTYGRSEPMENRQIEEEADAVDLEQKQLAQLQAAIMESRNLEEDDHAEAITKRVLFIDDKDNYFDGANELNNKTANQSLPLNGSEIHNATQVQIQNETVNVAANSTTEVPVESRNPRIINEDDNGNELEHSTQDPSVNEETSIPTQSLPAEEVTGKLEETTPQPFPANET